VSGDLALPVCTLFPGEDPFTRMDGPGTTEVSPNTYAGTTYTYLRGSQPMVTEAGDGWTLAHTAIVVGPEGTTPAPLVLDGAMPDPSTGASAVFSLYKDGGSPYDVETLTFSPCNDVDWTLNRHTVEFEGGNIELDLYLDINTIITAPSALGRAAGTLDGTPFEITDYFQLIYRPDHHHFGRHFAVVFAAPIGDVCALRIEEIDGQSGTTTAVVSTAGCDLSVLESRATISEGWELP
jgi:hypothetical protein